MSQPWMSRVNWVWPFRLGGARAVLLTEFFKSLKDFPLERTLFGREDWELSDMVISSLLPLQPSCFWWSRSDLDFSCLGWSLLALTLENKSNLLNIFWLHVQFVCITYRNVQKMYTYVYKKQRASIC